MLNRQSNKTNNTLNCSNYREHSDTYISPMNRETKAVNSSAYSLNLEQIIDTLDVQFLEMYDQPLIVVEMLLLEGIWQSKTYSEIALENHYSCQYLTNVAAPKLFKRLSQLVNYRITKKSCFSVGTKYILENTLYRCRSRSSEKEMNERSSDTIYDSYFTFGRGIDFDRDLFLKDAVLFAQLN